MKFAFCTSVEPSQDLPAVAARARDLGYDGVEVFLPTPAAGDPAAGTPLAERELVRLAFEQAGVQLASIAAPLHFVGERQRDEAVSDAVKRVLDLAARVRCAKVRILGMAAPPRLTAPSAAGQFAELLLPLADHACSGDVTLLVQNGLTFGTAPDLWRVMELACHSSLAVAWDPLAAALSGEMPAVSIPTLNSRIRHVLLRDATFTGEPPRREVASFARLGEGTLSPARLLDRLRGIGYRGWVSIAYPPASDSSAASLGTADELLRHSIGQVKGWQPKPPAGKKAGAKHA